MQSDAVEFRERLLRAAARDRFTRAIDDAWHWFQGRQDNEDLFSLHDQKQCLVALMEAMHWHAKNLSAAKHDFVAQQENLEGTLLPLMAKVQWDRAVVQRRQDEVSSAVEKGKDVAAPASCMATSSGA